MVGAEGLDASRDGNAIGFWCEGPVEGRRGEGSFFFAVRRDWLQDEKRIGEICDFFKAPNCRVRWAVNT